MSYFIYELYKSTAEKLMPVLKESQFLDKGVLTPEEFVLAGDELVGRCGTWTWSGGEASRRVSHLPEDKQVLITRNVPCLHRAAGYQLADQKEEEGDDGWVTTHVGMELKKQQEEVEDITLEEKKSIIPESAEEIDEIPDQVAEIEEEPDEAATDGFVLADDLNSNITRHRTYDLSISYDKYYQTPRMWLFGYDEDRNPLSSKKVMEDVSTEHAHKTVTIEEHPHFGHRCASIHPCRHSKVMKRIVEAIVENGKEPKVALSMFYFLKFIATIIPTIEYDYTISVDT